MTAICHNLRVEATLDATEVERTKMETRDQPTVEQVSETGGADEEKLLKCGMSTTVVKSVIIISQNE